MKYKIIVFIWLLLFINIEANAVSIDAKTKYPYSLLTNDYSILNENDLGATTWGFKPRPFTTKESSGQYSYWQCFPREFVMVTLSDNGHSPSEFEGQNASYLEIDVLLDGGIKHVYQLRMTLSIKENQRRFNKWLRLMKSEKYVCLSGYFVNQQKFVKNGKAWEDNGWVFEKLKTKKGCDSYFDSCTPTEPKQLSKVG